MNSPLVDDTVPCAPLNCLSCDGWDLVRRVCHDAVLVKRRFRSRCDRALADCMLRCNGSLSHYILVRAPPQPVVQ